MSKKAYFKKSAHLSNVVNPFDLVDTPSSDDDTGAISHSPQLPGHIIVSLRKASKKDVTSKLKAVEELQLAVMEDANVEQIKSALFAKHFVKVFAKLSVDPERRVREAAFLWLYKICEDPERRRSLQHIIGELAFYWLGALYDPVSAVSVLAKKCLEACFPTPEKLKQLVDTVKKPARQMITETVQFRAEQARELAVGDVDGKETADLLYALHLVRAVSCEAFLGRHDPDPLMCDLIMSVCGTSGAGWPLMSSAFYLYAMVITLPNQHAMTLIRLGMTDISNADLVIDLITSGAYAHLDLPLVALGDFCRSAISSLPRAIIAKVVLVVKRLPSEESRQQIIMATSRPNTLDTGKLKAIIEDLFSLLSADTREELFKMVVVERVQPWSNLDVLTALQAFTTAYGADFVDRQVEQVDCSTSVSLLVFKSRSGDTCEVCEQLSELTLSKKLSVKELTVILGEERLAGDEKLRKSVFDSFVDAVNKAQLFQYIPLFDTEQLLLRVSEPETVLRHLVKHGDQHTPWQLAIAQCQDEQLCHQLVSRMVQVTDYSDTLMDLLEHQSVNLLAAGRSWLAEERFAEWLIAHGHPDLVPVGVARKLQSSRQLQYINNCTADLSGFLDKAEFIEFAGSICRSTVSFKRTHFPALLAISPASLIDEQVFVALVERGALSGLECHVIVYLMWLEDACGGDYHGLINSLLMAVDEIELVCLSRRLGGYYSYILQLIPAESPLDPHSASTDHIVVSHRTKLRALEQITVGDLSTLPQSDLLLSVLIPFAGRLCRDVVMVVLGNDTKDTNLVAEFMAALSAAMAVKDAEIKQMIDQFIQSQPLAVTACILARHPDFAICSPARHQSILDAFFSGSVGSGSTEVCSLMRQVAPFLLEQLHKEHLTAIMCAAGCHPEWHRRRTARLMFNLLHDVLLQRLDVAVQGASDREQAVFGVLPREACDALIDPMTMDWFELLIGLVEACGDDLPVVASTLHSMVRLDHIVPILTDTLKWTCDGDLDLTRSEFTNLDWDQKHADHLLAANVMFRAWRTFPTAMRRAFTENGKIVPELRRHMSTYISPMIIQRELDKCRRYARTASPTSSLTVKVMSSSTQCQIVADYKVEEESVSVLVEIPADFPFTMVSVDCRTGRRGLPEGKWKAALLSATAIMSNSALLLPAITTWSANIDRMLSGIEPCSICYCVMHAVDRTLPTPTCGTCGNKFHAHCLYKWFRTGGQATCPMCRSLF